MWAKINAGKVRQENVVAMMQIDMLSLRVLETQMDNLTFQATVLIGFTLVMLGGETMLPLASDSSQVCIYKAWYTMLAAILHFFAIAISLSSGLVLVVVTSYVKQATQGAALVVSTGAAVAQTSAHVQNLTGYFVVCISAFAAQMALMIILFVGTPNRLQRPDRLVHDHEGAFYLACLDFHRRDHIELVTSFGAALAAMNSSVLLLVAAFLVIKMRAVRLSYKPTVLLEWHRAHEARQIREAMELHGTEQSSPAQPEAPPEASLEGPRGARSFSILMGGAGPGSDGYNSNADSTSALGSPRDEPPQVDVYGSPRSLFAQPFDDGQAPTDGEEASASLTAVGAAVQRERVRRASGDGERVRRASKEGSLWRRVDLSAVAMAGGRGGSKKTGGVSRTSLAQVAQAAVAAQKAQASRGREAASRATGALRKQKSVCASLRSQDMRIAASHSLEDVLSRALTMGAAPPRRREDDVESTTSS